MSSMVQRLLQQLGTGNPDVHQMMVIQVHEHRGYLGSPKGLAQPLDRNPHKAEWSQGRNSREGRTGV
jgi:hypothetical protein